MSNADRGDDGRGTLDWGEGAPETATTAEPGADDGGRDEGTAGEGATDDGADEANDSTELCSVEDPTCEACQ